MRFLMLNSKYYLLSYQISCTLWTPCCLKNLFASCFISLYLSFYRPKESIYIWINVAKLLKKHLTDLSYAKCQENS